MVVLSYITYYCYFSFHENVKMTSLKVDRPLGKTTTFVEIVKLTRPVMFTGALNGVCPPLSICCFSTPWAGTRLSMATFH